MYYEFCTTLENAFTENWWDCLGQKGSEDIISSFPGQSNTADEVVAGERS